MAKLSVKQVYEQAAELIEKHPGGIRHSEIYKWFRVNHPETPEGTLAANLSYVASKFPHRVRRVDRGLYAPVASDGEVAIDTPPPPLKLREEDVYEPFADFLVNDLGEAVEAVALGGSGLKDKWGTPDVIGVYRPTTENLIKFNTEIVAAEIKVDPSQPIVAFGQACAYRLFAAKCYVVMPNSISEKDLSRLESLCLVFGMGLVLFDPASIPLDFTIRVRAQRLPADMFYVNELADGLHRVDSSAFKKLFG
ncbi:MAG: hypothetical protein RBS39_00985 [Phycisphaerales bacterium]|nr:hypothetical protein [Phycisphaerales bacterium]